MALTVNRETLAQLLGAAMIERIASYPKLDALPAPIVVTVPRATPDPYTNHRLREEALGRDMLAQLTYDHPDNVRARKVAALRESMSKTFEPRFPPEGRSDRVYAENRR